MDAEISNLLKTWSAVDPAASDQLFMLVYDERRRMARRHMKGERPDKLPDSSSEVAFKPVLSSHDSQSPTVPCGAGYQPAAALRAACFKRRKSLLEAGCRLNSPPHKEGPAYIGV